MATKNLDDFFDTEIQQLREDNSKIQDWKDYNVFVFMCQKYYFFMDPDSSFSEDDIISSLTDGQNDGSIDAVTIDQSTENKNLVICQMKYQQTIDPTVMKGEMHEMFNTFKDLKAMKYGKYRNVLVQRFIDCEAKKYTKPDIAYFTSACPKQNTRKKIEEAITSEFGKDASSIHIFYGDDIKAFIEGCKEQKAYVMKGELELDSPNNKLKYQDSVIVNVKAKSLKELYSRVQRSLFGMNLRFYIRNKKVDDGLKNTIKTCPQKFWYLNNGLVIACDNYEIDGNIVRFEKFSIINGGQTTDMIRNTDFDDDFSIVCKIVKLDMDSQNSPRSGLTATEIAEATNSQKPIKPKDLVANRSEQRDLKGRLKKVKVQYILKNESIDKEYKDKNRHTTIDAIGKIAMAGILQIPSSRSGSDDLYKEENGYYNHIYRKAKAQVLADLLRIDNCYKSFINSNDAKNTENPTITRNARTYALSSISLLSLMEQSIEPIDLSDLQYKQNKMDCIISKIESLDSLFPQKKDDEDELLYKLFSVLSSDVFSYCYGDEREKNQDLDESNYLKKKDTYFSMIKRINALFHRTGGTDLRVSADDLFGR